MGVLTEVFMGIDEVLRGLAMWKQTLVVHRCLPFFSWQRRRLLFLNNQSNGAEALRSDAAVSGWVTSSLRCGKGQGVAGEVKFIGAQPGSDRRGVPVVSQLNSSFHFPRFNSFV
jgi:hypothetical protein